MKKKTTKRREGGERSQRKGLHFIYCNILFLHKNVSGTIGQTKQSRPNQAFFSG
jgi:hypothetical protein